MLPHFTVAGTHFMAAVVVACMFPAAVGIVVGGVAALAPSGPAVVVVVVDAAFVAAIAVAVAAVATVAAVDGWVVPDVVGDEAAIPILWRLMLLHVCSLLRWELLLLGLLRWR